MNISIAIVCYNEQENIISCLESIKHQHFPPGKFEMLVVDNDSTDGTMRTLKHIAENFPIPMRIISNPVRGIAASRNVALREAQHDKILFIDADCVAPQDWVKRYTQAWSDEADGYKIVAAGGGNVAPRKGNPFQCALGIMLDSVLGSRGSVQGLLFDSATVIDHHPGLNLLIDRHIALSIGGFDEDKYNFMGEDQDLSIRLNAEGYKYLFVPNNAVEHKLRDSWRAWAKNMYDYGKGRALLIEDHPAVERHTFLAIRLFVPMMMLSLGTAVTALLAGWQWWALPMSLPLGYIGVIFIYSAALCFKAGHMGLWPQVAANFLVTHLYYSLGLNRSSIGARVNDR